MDDKNDLLLYYEGSRQRRDLKVTAFYEAQEAGLLGLPVKFRPEIATHSPDGFEWGYTGSGPAELAKQMLLHFYGDLETITRQEVLDGMHPTAYIYQLFKWQFIAKLSRYNWTIMAEEIRQWLEKPDIVNLFEIFNE